MDPPGPEMELLILHLIDRNTMRHLRLFLSDYVTLSRWRATPYGRISAFDEAEGRSGTTFRRLRKAAAAFEGFEGPQRRQGENGWLSNYTHTTNTYNIRKI
ncbi:hypothetical protein CPLU01_05046 [Colletotrichum plurivorum]|uniref:Uncharacterized protein n=1 Tax=Colletotrichum plurivorum TaxID=2175906 RepID=A0A8H6KMV4_9PEZI|nr:hypothetical protein CPLU01_05046 [Colletotrichum plurivorum]